MIIVMKSDATEAQVKHVIDKIKEAGLKPVVSKGIARTIIGVIGREDILQAKPIEIFPGVEKVMPVLAPFKLVSREFKPEPTIVNVNGVKIGDKSIVVMAGPCSVENKERLVHIARDVKKAGAKMLRGGAFKPRSSPYSFQGLGEEGLEYLAEARQQTGLPIVTEVLDPRDVELVERYADVIQIGARNMQNFALLKEIGLAKKPVLLKRGFSATINEWLMAAEYIVSNGNFNVILCERGIRTFEQATRFTLDVSAVPVVKQLTHLPVIVDPSHAAGLKPYVAPLARAGIAAGADGLLIEVHPKPEEALCDGTQALLPRDFAHLMEELRGIAHAIGRTL